MHLHSDADADASLTSYLAVGRYYSGEAHAYVPTLFIGGNHEASNYLGELFYGGWAAPDIYYLGACGVVRFGGLRIGGISGIFKSHDYRAGRHEAAPFDNSSLRSTYVRAQRHARLGTLTVPHCTESLNHNHAVRHLSSPRHVTMLSSVVISAPPRADADLSSRSKPSLI